MITLALLSGCGPIAYVRQVPYDAAEKVEHARALGADKLSPYWWTRAVVYLHMAREVAAHADYQGANPLRPAVVGSGGEAAEESDAASRDPSKLPVNPTKDVAPAKDDGMAPAKE